MACKIKHSDYNSDNIYTWCTNCGNYGIHGALKNALLEECLAPSKVVLCFDIGCHGNGADKINGYNVHGLHGRIIPFASGVAIANQKIPVIASAGDGATLGEGVNHLVHAIRNNYNVTLLLHDNENYGLTTGQASPTTRLDYPMNSSPDGTTARPINVLDFVFSLEPTFVARGYSGYTKQLTRIIRAAIQHRGFSFVQILQDCPTYNKATPHEWYLEHTFDVGSLMNYNVNDLSNARIVANDLTDKVATGVLYQEERPTFMDMQKNRKGISTELIEEVKEYDANDLFESYK